MAKRSKPTKRTNSAGGTRIRRSADSKTSANKTGASQPSKGRKKKSSKRKPATTDVRSPQPRRANKKRVAASRSQRTSHKQAGGRQTDRQEGLVRLQRFLASAGFGSRRECEALIEEGRVIVDQQVVDQLGSKVDPHKQKVFVDGSRVAPERLEYYILNKPPGVVSTSRDPSGRLRVIDLINTKRRVYNVGRLDKSSEGLILVTNDGDLANRLTHPSFGVAKTYHVQVEGEPTRETIKSLLEGMYLAEGFAKMANVKVKKRQKTTSWLEIVLEEGRNREIRRLLAKAGHKVLRLRRIAIGPIRLGELPLGAHRRLEPKELKALRYSISRTPQRTGPRTRRTKSAALSRSRKSSSKAVGATKGKQTPNKKHRTRKKTRSR